MHATNINIQTGKHLPVVQAILIADKSTLHATNIHLDTPLHVAASEGYLEVVQECIRNGAPINVINQKGDSPLMCAVGGGHKGVVLVLIADGNADRHVVNKDGLMPIRILYIRV